MISPPQRAERRKEPRSALHLPIQVQGHTAAGAAWLALSTSEDVSRDGVGFALKEAVIPGVVLRLSLPLPPSLRPAGQAAEGGYRVFAHVRHTTGINPARVGCLFL